MLESFRLNICCGHTQIYSVWIIHFWSPNGLTLVYSLYQTKEIGMFDHRELFILFVSTTNQNLHLNLNAPFRMVSAFNYMTKEYPVVTTESFHEEMVKEIRTLEQCFSVSSVRTCTYDNIMPVRCYGTVQCL